MPGGRPVRLGKMILLLLTLFYIIPHFLNLYLISVANVIGYTILSAWESTADRLLRAGHIRHALLLRWEPTPARS